LTVDESHYTRANNHPVKKEAANDDNYSQGADPFLLSQTLIITGVGTAVVCAVGINSRRGMY
jgi:hypothetical protein